MGIYVDNWKIRVDLCGYSIKSYLHAGRPPFVFCTIPATSFSLGSALVVGKLQLKEGRFNFLTRAI
jgi:hypothetical protein